MSAMERRLRVGTKVPVSQPVPRALRARLKAVVALMDADDPCVTQEADDLIQLPQLVGGLEDAAARRFLFTYFPQRHGDAEWSLTLTESEVRSIASGRVEMLNLFRCAAPSCENRATDASETCSDCDYITTGGPKAPDALVVSRIKSKEEWVAVFLQLNPGALWSHAMMIYNRSDEPGDRLGYFSPNELEETIRRLSGQ